MAELTIILIVVACTAWVCIAWVVWTVREFKRALKEAGFDEACGMRDRATKIPSGEPDENHNATGACSCRPSGGTLVQCFG